MSKSKPQLKMDNKSSYTRAEVGIAEIPEYVPSESTTAISNTTIREAIRDFLRRCNTPYSVVSMPDDVKNACIDNAIHVGYPMQNFDSLKKYFEVGAMMAYTSYSHREFPVRMYVARYTSIHLYLDDHFKKHLDGLKQFIGRFLRRETQDEDIFRCLAHLLLELPYYFDVTACNLMTVSTLNYVASLILEHDTRDMALMKGALGYPEYSRKLSGIAESFAFFIFVRECPTSAYIQALPEIMTYLCYTNDILSFYKEELADDKANYVTFLATCHDMIKEGAFQHLIHECVVAYERVVNLLRPHTEAYETWTNFCKRYSNFHTSLGRYKLEELDL